MLATLKDDFAPQNFLPTVGSNKNVLFFKKRQIIFTQGDKADSVFYLLQGTIRLTVVAQNGKEATLGILEEKSFFGEDALAGRIQRIETAQAMTDCRVLRVGKQAMLDAMHREHSFSDHFLAYLLARNIKYEEDLVDQLFNSSEKRLARILLQLAHYGNGGVQNPMIPKVSQETLAQMVGTTRSRVSHFMNKFRKRGFVDYDNCMENGLEVHDSLLNVVLDD